MRAVAPSRISVRTLYLLALFQLVAGPLVLVTLFTFARVMEREAPQHGIVKAAQLAWESHEVQTTLQVVCPESQDTSKTTLPKLVKEKIKIVGIVWAEESLPQAVPIPSEASSRSESWTPVWPQAPPGTPPRAA